MASAVLFTEAVARKHPETEFVYFSMGYGPNPVIPAFDGEDNAILDYRYVPDDRLTHYFDHHPTAFASDQARAHFQERAASEPERFSFRPDCGSCTKMLAGFAAREGVDLSRHAELIHWAHKLDTANFKSAEDATDRSVPELQLSSVVTQFGDDAFLREVVPLLLGDNLGKLCESKFIKDHYRKIAPLYREYAARLRKGGKLVDGVLRADLVEPPIKVVEKFAQYREFPEAIYSVITARKGQNYFLSVGHNPWSATPCEADIGQLCARHGGGGHRFVGGISVPGTQADVAFRIAEQITRTLRDQHKS
jgi:hypothetical protein